MILSRFSDDERVVFQLWFPTAEKVGFKKAVLVLIESVSGWKSRETDFFRRNRYPNLKNQQRVIFNLFSGSSMAVWVESVDGDLKLDCLVHETIREPDC